MIMAPMSKKEAGRRGGLTTALRHGVGHLREIARRGGQATKARLGRRHYSKIGKVGLQRRIDKRWNGDRKAYVKWFVAKGQFAQDPFPQNGAFPHPGSEPGPDGHSPGYISLDDWGEEWDRIYTRYDIEQQEREAGE